MNNYYATFGCGQANEGYYVKIVTETYANALNYMETEYNGKYCMVYGEKQWLEWVETANKNYFLIEKELKEITI